MFCPHCGAENDASNRFCVNCGAELSKAKKDLPDAALSIQERLRRLVGTTRRARLISAATVAAILIAIVAFIALDPSEESVDQDAYLSVADSRCVAEKERISTLERETLAQRPPNVEEFASVLVTIVAVWRADLRSPPPPAVHAEGVNGLEMALGQVLIEAGALQRLAREGSAKAIAAQAKAVDEATAQVDSALEALKLTACADLVVTPTSVAGA